MDERQTPNRVQGADNSYASMRPIAHLTRARCPAPDVYRIPGKLENSDGFLPDISHQLPRGIAISLKEKGVAENGSKDRILGVTVACGCLPWKAQLAKHMHEEWDLAQNVIAGQCCRTPRARRRECDGA
jgi:hypothetical protein